MGRCVTDAHGEVVGLPSLAQGFPSRLLSRSFDNIARERNPKDRSVTVFRGRALV